MPPWFRKQDKPDPPRRSLLASAVNLSRDGVAAWRARQGEDSWQREAWYQYDITGELRYALNWVANAVSLADLYIAEVDPDTGLITGPTEDATVQAVGRTILGGTGRRSQLQSTISLNVQVAGEVFILVRPKRDAPDEWLVLSSSEVSERGGTFKYADPTTGAATELNPSRDLLIRLWNPHPREQHHADSAVRASLPVLREIEKTSQNIAARLDSRLVGSGLLVIPQEVDFAAGDSDPAGAQGFMEYLAKAMEASLSNPGSASAQVPIVAEAPGEQVANFNHLTFETELSAEVLELRTAAIRRLALGLDMPAEIMTGMGESNHWSAWQIEEAAYKIHVAPDLDKIGDGITEAYLRPTLEALDIPSPERFVVAFDTTEIISRPNRVEEITNLWDRILVSDDALRTEAGVPDSEIPTDEERDRRFVEKLVLQDTSLLLDAGVREVLGLPQVAPAASSEQSPALPSGEPESTAATPSRPAQAEESDAPDEGLVAAAELVVYDALKRAGGRLLTRHYRGRYESTPKFELHTVIPCGDVERCTEGSFEFTDRVAGAFGVSPQLLDEGLRDYVSNLLRTGEKHNREVLRGWLHHLMSR